MYQCMSDLYGIKHIGISYYYIFILGIYNVPIDEPHQLVLNYI